MIPGAYIPVVVDDCLITINQAAIQPLDHRIRQILTSQFLQYFLMGAGCNQKPLKSQTGLTVSPYSPRLFYECCPALLVARSKCCVPFGSIPGVK